MVLLGGEIVLGISEEWDLTSRARPVAGIRGVTDGLPQIGPAVTGVSTRVGPAQMQLGECPISGISLARPVTQRKLKMFAGSVRVTRLPAIEEEVREIV